MGFSRWGAALHSEMGGVQGAWKVIVGKDLGGAGLGIDSALVKWMRGRRESAVNWIDVSFYGLMVVPALWLWLAVRCMGGVSRRTHPRGR